MLSIKALRAKKEHRCEFCGRGIGLGERHIAITIADSGTIWVPRMCLKCDKIIVDYKLFKGDEPLDPDIYEERIHDLCIDRNIPYKGVSVHELVDKILAHDAKED